MISNGVLDVKQIVNDRIPLDRIIEDGLEKLLVDKTQAKILVKIHD